MGRTKEILDYARVGFGQVVTHRGADDVVAAAAITDVVVVRAVPALFLQAEVVFQVGQRLAFIGIGKRALVALGVETPEQLDITVTCGTQFPKLDAAGPLVAKTIHTSSLCVHAVANIGVATRRRGSG